MAGLDVQEWGSGEPALLVHGSFGWGEETWRDQRPLAEDYHLLVVDRRGFGSAPDPPDRVDFERDAHDVAALLAEPTHLVGHSYGGIVAMLAAAQAPAHVRSLCVIEPPALGLVLEHDVARSFLDEVLEASDRASTASEYQAAFLAAFGFPPPRDEPSAAAQRAAHSSWGERWPHEAEIPLDVLERAPFPKLVARGAWDAAPPAARERGARIFELICDVLVARLNAEEAVFPGAAHNPQHLGAPFNERLRAFWG